MELLKTLELNSPSPRSWSALLPAALVVTVGLVVTRDLETQRVEARGGWCQDTDSDGIPDKQEAIFGSSPFSADTDGDGYQDGWEIAVGSSPVRAGAIPLGYEPMAAHMSGRTVNGQLRLFATTYSADGTFADKAQSMVMLIDGQKMWIPGWILYSRGQVLDVDLGSAGALRYFDFALPIDFVQAYGEMTVGLRSYHPGQVSNGWTSAGVVDLIWSSGVVVIRKPASEYGVPGDDRTATLPTTSEGLLPELWDDGRICLQAIELVGTIDGKLIYEVVDADCEDGWDSFCAFSDCVDSIASTFQTLDPAALAGG